MNKVEQIVAALSDEQLKSILCELKARRDTGVLPDGETRALARCLINELGVTMSDAMNIACVEPMNVAALKWAGLPYGTSEELAA